MTSQAPERVGQRPDHVEGADGGTGGGDPGGEAVQVGGDEAALLGGEALREQRACQPGQYVPGARGGQPWRAGRVDQDRRFSRLGNDRGGDLQQHGGAELGGRAAARRARTQRAGPSPVSTRPMPPPPRTAPPAASTAAPPNRSLPATMPTTPRR